MHEQPSLTGHLAAAAEVTQSNEPSVADALHQAARMVAETQDAEAGRSSLSATSAIRSAATGRPDRQNMLSAAAEAQLSAFLLLLDGSHTESPEQLSTNRLDVIDTWLHHPRRKAGHVVAALQAAAEVASTAEARTKH